MVDEDLGARRRRKEPLSAEAIAALNAQGEYLDRMFPLAGHRYFGRNGSPIGFGDWAARMGTDEQLVMSSYIHRDGRRVDVTKWEAELEEKDWKGATHVSTVWLGLDHNWHGGGQPIIFETMIFHAFVADLEDWQDRYSTEDEAKAGHERAVELVLAALPPKP